MIFESKLPRPPRPSSDVFNYIFNLQRRAYPRNRVIYRVDQTNTTLTLAELEEKSRRFANAIVARYDIRPNDVVGIFARDKVSLGQPVDSFPFFLHRANSRNYKVDRCG